MAGVGPALLGPSEIRQLAERLGITPSRRLGQNFVVDPGTVSRITARLSGPVTTARSEVDVIVTEFGAAELKGQTLAERTRRLTAIAHPGFREDLEREARLIRQRGFG